MTQMGEFVSDNGSSDYEAINDEDAYTEVWELPLGEADELVSEAGVAQRGGAIRPMTILSRDANGQVTVQLNKPMTYDISVPFNGTVTGTVAVGSTLTGKDSNNNGIPDLLEKCIHNNRCRF